MKTSAEPAVPQVAHAQPAFSQARGGSFFGPEAKTRQPFFSPAFVQPKLSIGQPGDKYEQEADAVADRVVQRLANPGATIAVQKKCQDCAEKEKLRRKEEEPVVMRQVDNEQEEAPAVQAKAEKEEEESKVMRQTANEQEEAPPVQAKENKAEEAPGLMRQAGPEEEEPLQAKAEAGASTSPSLQSRLSSAKGAGAPMDKNTRQPMEAAFGQDFGRVRIHTDNNSAQMNRELNARAFTHGRDIYFNAGEYSPGSTEGRRLLAHELVHVGQQRMGENYIIQKKHTNPKEKEPSEAISKYKYFWESPSIRSTNYRDRERELKSFLMTYKEVDLWKNLSKVTKQDLIFLQYERIINMEIEKWDNIVKIKEKEIPKIKEKLTKQKTEWRTSVREIRNFYQLKETRKLLSGLYHTKIKIAKLNPINIILKSRIRWYSLWLKKESNKEKVQQFKYASITHKKLLENQKINEDKILKLKKTANEISEKINKHLLPLRGMEKKISITYHETSKIMKTIESDIKEKRRNIVKYKKLDITKIIQWEKEKYFKTIDGMSHDKLLTLVKSRMQQEPSHFPPWVKFMILHFSGIKYQSAHGSWASPLNLLRKLTAYKLKEDLSGYSDERISSSIKEVKNYIQGNIKNEKSRKKRNQLSENLKILNSDEKLYKKTKLKIIYEHKLENKFKQTTSDEDALLIIKRIIKYFPIWVQKEVVNLTRLKLEGDNIFDNDNSSEEDNLTWKSIPEKIWKNIIREWKLNITEWRTKSQKDLSPIVTRAVCNEISEYAQYARGVRVPGGMTSKSAWYRRMMHKSYGNYYFKIPMNENDIKIGSTIFWLSWSESYNMSNIASPIPGLTYKKDERFNDLILGLDKQSGYTYHLNGGRYIRTHPGNSGLVVWTEPVISSEFPHLETEYLKWTHEATIIDIVEIGNKKTVLTFEPSGGGTGLKRRSIASLLGHWNIYLGYAPENPSQSAIVMPHIADISQ